MNDTKEIKITTENSKLYAQKYAFDKRWNNIDTNENKEQFKIRCLIILDNIFNKNSPEKFATDTKAQYINDFCLEISSNIGILTKANTFDNFAHKELYKYIKELNIYYDKNFITLLMFLQLSLNYDFKGYISNKELATQIAEAMKLCNIKAKIINNKGIYEIYPSNLEFLDTPLIIDTLNWLNMFPDAKSKLENAIKANKANSSNRNIVDDLRLCIELFLRKILNNGKTLENQKSDIGSYLKSNNISKEISNMYISLIDYYAKYNDNHAKHHDSINEVEIDYLIYLTGSFITFIMLIEEQKNKL